jgi:hypothetical protein
LRSNKPDEAVRTLERAVNLHPTNGGNYYYLAEAWLMKGNVRQAREFMGSQPSIFAIMPNGRIVSRPSRKGSQEVLANSGFPNILLLWASTCSKAGFLMRIKF